MIKIINNYKVNKISLNYKLKIKNNNHVKKFHRNQIYRVEFLKKI